MTSGQFVTVLVALLGGGGAWNAIQKIIDARAKRAELRERQPETSRDSSVDRAQKALLVMEGALDAAVQRAEAAETRVAELEQQIDQFEAALATLRRQLDDATVQLNQATNQLATLRDQMPPRTETT